MNSEQIARELGRVKTPAEAHRLILASEARIQELNERIKAIAPSGIPSLFPHPPERARALQKSPEAVKVLDDEIAAHHRELDHLVELRRMSYETMERAELDEIRRGIPEARKRLPGLMREVREAMAAYETKIAAMNEALGVLNSYGRAELPFPLDDEQLAEVLRLREDIWRVRTITAPYIDDRARFPLSWPLLHELHNRGLGESGAYHVRRPPTPHSFPDGDPVISRSAGRA